MFEECVVHVLFVRCWIISHISLSSNHSARIMGFTLLQGAQHVFPWPEGLARCLPCHIGLLHVCVNTMSDTCPLPPCAEQQMWTSDRLKWCMRSYTLHAGVQWKAL